MKSARWMCTIAMALLVALAIPVGVAARGNQNHNHHKDHHYKLLDLGTFGGPQSWVFGWNEVPGIMSNAGAVVGGANTSDSNPNYPNYNPFMGLPFMLYPLNSDPFVEHAFVSKDGALVDLGVLPGGYNSFAQWISGNGNVVGASENGGIDPLTGWPEIRSVLWREGQAFDLGTLEGGTESTTLWVNDQGAVAGGALDSAGVTHAILWTRDRILHDLGAFGSGALATQVNEPGQVAGVYTPCSTCNQDVFFWERGNAQGIPDFGGPISFANDMNDQGQIVGQSDLTRGASAHAFLWDRKKKALTDLGTLGGPGSTAHWINDAGDVVGEADTQSALHAALWKHGKAHKITDLGTVAGDLCSLAHSINSEGQIVGYSDDCSGTPIARFPVGERRSHA
jgi:probable HAF family extracellular repeat protein